MACSYFKSPGMRPPSLRQAPAIGNGPSGRELAALDNGASERAGVGEGGGRTNMRIRHVRRLTPEDASHP
jgi:hypothetical protein